jgi:UDP-N-acetyl-D-glucosamine dehydrogenase
MMPAVVTSLVADGLNRSAKSIRKSKVLVLGVAYKKNVSDCRESPALDVMRMLSEKGAELSYNDPYVPTLRLGKDVMKSTDLSSEIIAKQDCVIILTDHSDYDFKQITATAQLVIDTRNATKDLHVSRDNIIKLGAGNNVRTIPYHEDEHESAGLNSTTH